MDENEQTVSTARLKFGQQADQTPVEETQTEAVQAEEAQQEAMTAEAEEQPSAVVEADVAAAETLSQEALVEAANEAEALNSEVEAEAQTETSDETTEGDAPLAVEAEPVSDGTVDGEDAVEPSVSEEVGSIDQTVEPVPVPDDNEGLVDAVNTEAAHEAYRNSEEETETTDVLAQEDLPVEDAVEQVEPVSETVVQDAVAAETAPLENGKSVEELQAERQKLDDEIKQRQNAEKASVIAQIKNVAENYGVTPDELVEAMGGLRSKRKGVKAKPKYRDPATGAIWSGRGKEPAWIKGQVRDPYLITE